MKKVLLFVFLLSVLGVSGQENKLDWLVNFEKAKLKSKKGKKPIMMYFTGSDWCVPCKALKEDFFSTSKFKKQSKNLVLLKVDIPRREDIISNKQLIANKKLVNKYNKQKGFPLIVMLNYKGKVIDVHGSYSTSLRDPSRYFSFVESTINNY